LSHPRGTRVRATSISQKHLIILALLGVGFLAVLAASASAAERGYELVSPPDKGGTDAGGFYQPYSSDNGEVSVFQTLNALPGAEPNSNGVINTYRSVRGPGGWTTSQLGYGLGAVNTLNTALYSVFSNDLMAGVQYGPLSPPGTPDAAEGSLNLYLNDASGFHLLTKGVEPYDAEFNPEAIGGSDDLSHVVFSVYGSRLSEESPAGVFPVLYEWDTTSETPRIVGRLPDESPSADATTIATPPGIYGNEGGYFNPISADGSRIFFYTPDNPATRELYVRVDGSETRWVSASQRTVPDPASTPGPTFRVAADDGSVAYFTSKKKLTDDATTGPSDGGEDLYRYDLDSGQLTDVTVDSTDTNGAEVQGVLGAAADGSSVYFVAKGVLAAGATAGGQNLYRWHEDGTADGAITFVAPDAHRYNWTPEYFSPLGAHVISRVTPDGEHLLFESAKSLTGYPNEGRFEVYLYDAETEQLRCASCNPGGTPATADAVAAGAGDTIHVARTLSDDGSRVFFTTTEQLAPGDTNSAGDTYEYDATTGEINLISSGKGNAPAMFSDASADGSNVFFSTRQQLVGIDRDSNYDVYDARVGGGIAAQNPAPPPPPCEAEACRAAVAVAPPPPTAGSSQVSGASNVKRKHKHHRKRHRHRHHKGKHGNQSRGRVR
jgi:Tol biopolymer transport system component